MAGIANIDNQSLRGFLRMVETEFPDDFVRVRQEIDPKFELHRHAVRARPGRAEPGRCL